MRYFFDLDTLKGKRWSFLQRQNKCQCMRTVKVCAGLWRMQRVSELVSWTLRTHHGVQRQRSPLALGFAGY